MDVMTLRIVDVSRWQVERPDPLDLVRARDAGIGAVNIALDRGRGDDVMPPWALRYTETARRLGLGVCTYRWLDGRLSGSESAARAYLRMRMVGVEGMAHAVDCEADAPFEVWRDYVARMQDLLQRPIVTYTGDWWWQPRGWTGAGYLWAAPNGGYLPDYPGDESPQWTAGYGGWAELDVMQYAVRPLPGTGPCSMSAVRAGYVWQDLTGGGLGMRVAGIPYVQGANSYSDRDSKKFAIAIHNTSNDAPASGEAGYATRRTDGVSAHFYVDGRDVIQSLDTAAKAGHAGSGYGNENAIAVEITGSNDKSRDWWLANVAWAKLGWVLAQVCQHYAISVRHATVAEMASNPQIRAFYSHDDMRRAWGGTTHTDPGPNFPWDKLFASVNAALSGKSQGGLLVALSDQQQDDMYQWAAAMYQGEERRPSIRFREADGSITPNALVLHYKNLMAAIEAMGNAPAATGWTDDQVTAAAEKIGAALAARPDVPVSQEHVAATVEAVKTVLREGVG